MAEMLEERRESWGTRSAFVFAAIGSAVGLGNLWAFPYKIYSYGGGAFLIPYIIAMFCVGIPVMILEFSAGHFTQRAAPEAFARTNKRFEMVGWWGTLLAFVIATYYPIVLGYCLSFMFYSLKAIAEGNLVPWAGQGAAGVENARRFFEVEYLTAGAKWGPFQVKVLIPLMIAWAAMYFSIFRGVKLIGKVAWLTVPLPWLMLMVLTVRGLTLEGSMKGLVYYLDPVWGELAKPSTWRYAFGQVFFSMSLGFGTMLTYASFLHRSSDINNNAAVIGIADFATSFIAGLAIFSTLGGMAYVTQAAGSAVPVQEIASGGPGLAFVAFPYALAQLPSSAWWSFGFFFILFTLGLNSAFSITECVLASIVDKTGWPRWLVLVLMTVVGIALGLFYTTGNGLDKLGTMDGFINGTWGIALLGLLECAVLGWGYRIENLRAHANERSDWRIAKWWTYLVRIVIPVILGTLFFWNLLDDLSSKCFIRTLEGELLWGKIVGICVVVLAPTLAILISKMKSPERPEEFDEYCPAAKAQPSSIVGGMIGGMYGFIAAASAMILMLLVILFGHSLGWLKAPLMAVAATSALAGILICNFVMDRHDRSTEGPSWFARIGGIISVFAAGAFAAVVLNSLTARIQVREVEAGEHLSNFSYVLLGIVAMLVVGGLGWCTYRAMAAANSEPAPEKRG